MLQCAHSIHESHLLTPTLLIILNRTENGAGPPPQKELKPEQVASVQWWFFRLFRFML
jgi:hypothetical protein